MADLSKLPAPPSFPRTLVDPSRLKTEVDFRAITTALADEMCNWLAESTFLMPDPTRGWKDEGQAILCAQVVRLSKMLGRMSKALDATDEEAAMIFCRCAFETIVNFHYLRIPTNGKVQAEDRLRLYKMSGYRPELKIRRDLRARDAQGDPALDELERAALDGLNAYWEAEAMPDKVQELPIMANRLRMADMDPMAEIYYFAIPSQAIHGTYQNLTKFHLQPGEANGTMAPRFEADEITTTIFQGIVEQSLSVLDQWLLCVHRAVHLRWRDDLVEFRERIAIVHNALADAIRERSKSL